MESFNHLKHGDHVLCTQEPDRLKVVIWRGEMYFAGKKDMWPASEFDPADWVKEPPLGSYKYYQ